MFNKNKCYNGGKKHNFRPRYTKKYSSGHLKIDEPSIITPEQIKAIKIEEEFYHCDVCTWCGKVINKQKESE